jgi:hypothetical protein
MAISTELEAPSLVVMAAHNLKREYLHQSMADSCHSSVNRKRSAGSTHRAQQVLKKRRHWRSKIDCGYRVTFTVAERTGLLTCVIVTQPLIQPYKRNCGYTIGLRDFRKV